MFVTEGGGGGGYDYFAWLAAQHATADLGAAPTDATGGSDYGSARAMSDQLVDKLGTCTGWWGGDELGLLGAFL